MKGKDSLRNWAKWGLKGGVGGAALGKEVERHVQVSEWGPKREVGVARGTGE